MKTSRRTLRRALLVAAAGALGWGLTLQATGGVALDTPWGAISSRNPVRPLSAGAALFVWYAIVGRRSWREDAGPLARPDMWPAIVRCTAIALALVVGLGWGSRSAAGPDASGYVSEAALFARGELVIPTPTWARDAPWENAPHAAAPLGWRPSRDPTVLAPTYSPGYPLIMAAVQNLFGAAAIYYVVAVLGAVLVWSTYLLGAGLGGPWTGVIAAVLIVSSPTFLLVQLQVMSDVPFAAILTLSLATVTGGSHAWIAGAAAGAAVLIRPNLAPLAAAPLLLLLMRDRRLAPIAVFCVPVAAACGSIAALNWYYYGSPFSSGYGPLSSLYSQANFWPNLKQYGRWFVQLHTALPLIGLAAVFTSDTDRRRIAVVTLLLPSAVLVLYALYFVFQADEWDYTRFLLPGYPGLFAGVGLVAIRTAARARPRAIAVGALIALVAAVAAYGWTRAITSGIFTQQTGDARYLRAVEFANRLPERSILISNSHSGTLRFYTNRDILRFEQVRPAEIDTAIEHLHRLGYSLYLIGDEFEMDLFRERFAGTRTVRMLSAPPLASLRGAVVYQVRR